VLDFFPIEGTYQSFDEIEHLYAKFGHADRVAMREGFHGHQFSTENQEAGIDFLDHFNGMPRRHGFAAVKELDEKALQCTRTGQVMLDYPDARSLMDLIRDYYLERKNHEGATLKQLYFSEPYPEIRDWRVAEYDGGIPCDKEIAWESVGSSQFEGITIDRYLLHHSRYLEIPMVWIRRDRRLAPVMIWMGENGKVSAQDWRSVKQHVESGTDIVSIDPRGLGETRMPYKAVSEDDPALAQLDFDQAYVSPLSSVLADYVYNSILTGRPYFLQLIEDVEIAIRFVRTKSAPADEITVTGERNGFTLATAVAETLPGARLVSQPGAQALRWSELVEQKRELWPVEDLMPGGAYIH